MYKVQTRESFVVAMRCCGILFACVVAVHFQCCAGHGRLIEPPSRASAWRYGFQTPPDYNDHELYCGGFTRQWKRNDGKCGECGDAWDSPEPRAHEYGGQWGQGVIVRKYVPGSEMLIRVELTASHMGYFEFRICPEPDAKQDCLDRHVLKILGGSPAQPAPSDLDTRFYPRNGSRIYEIKAQLPDDLKCDQCVLQWRYIAGNNWGICPDGNGAVGCGPQEEFRACSDIALGEGAYTPLRPIRPTMRTTTRPKSSTESTQTDDVSTTAEEESSPVAVIVILLVLFLLSVLAVWYLYRYKNAAVKQWIESVQNRLHKQQRKTAPIVAAPTKTSIFHAAPECIGRNTGQEKCFSLALPPVPPPRVKRQTRIKELSPDESSVA